MFRVSSERIFAGRDADDYLNEKKRSLTEALEKEPDDYILNAPEEEYVDYLVAQFSVEPLELRVQDVSVTTDVGEIPADYFPHGFSVERGEAYRKNIIRYHVPFTGDRTLLNCKPNPWISWTTPVILTEEEVCFDIIDFYGRPETIKQQADEILNHMRVQFGHLSIQVNSFIASMPEFAMKALAGRKRRIKAKSDMLSKLGVPVKKSENAPTTFSVPSPVRRRPIQVEKPSVSISSPPEPTLGEKTYQQILQTIDDVCKQFERMPATYFDKSEEQLRDHILLVLEPNFEGSATGETFNKKGKTDILLRHEGQNVFIAECKFWKGSKSFLSSITQLLSYLTWRDSKAAVILFVRNKAISPVVEAVEKSTPAHANFVSEDAESGATFPRYRIHLEGDSDRHIVLTVLMYHLHDHKAK